MTKSHRSPRELGRKEFSLLSPKPNFEKIIFYLLVLLLPTQFGKHFWPPFSQVLGIRVDYLSPTLYTTDLLIIVLFFFWIKKSPTLFFRSFYILHSTFYIFLTYLILNIVFSNSPLLALYGFTKILELIFLCIYVAQYIKNTKELTTIAAIFSITVIGESLLAIAQYIHQGSINGLLYFLGERKFSAGTPGIANASINGELILRPYATFSHPNVLAGYLLCSLIIIFSWFKAKENILKKFLKISSLLVGSIALFFTLSRIAITLWFLLAIAIVFRLFFSRHSHPVVARAEDEIRTRLLDRHVDEAITYSTRLPRRSFLAPRNDKNRIKDFLPLLIIIVSFIFFLFTPLPARLKGTNFAEEAFSQRVDLFKSTLIMIKDHPLFGVGLYNFIPALSRVQKPLSPILYLQPVHNIFLLITAEIGLVGLSFFLWFLYKTYRHLSNFPIFTRTPLLIMLSTILILSLFDHYWLTLQQGQLLFSLILGLCWARQKPGTIKQ